MKSFFIVLICFSFISPGSSQSADSIKKYGPSYFNFAYDNDFFSATDRYYTQGTILTFIHPGIRHSPVTYILMKLKHASVSFHGLQLEQDVFTPRSIRYMGGAIYKGERPFTATIFLSQLLSSLDIEKKLALHSQLDIGILGPLGLGEQTQKGIHKALVNIEPQGWDNQLSQDVVLNYRARLEKGLVTNNNFEFLMTTGFRLGTLYTDASAGLHARFGILNPYFNTLGLQNKTDLRKKFTVTLVMKANAKAVGYNATLQGGITNNGNIYDLPDESLSRIVGELHGGLLLGYKNLTLEYSRTYITKEFEGGVDHGWGRCAVSVCF